MFISKEKYQCLVDAEEVAKAHIREIQLANEEVTKKNHALEKKIDELEDDYKTLLKKKDNETELHVHEKTQELSKAKDALTIQNNKLQAENDLLKKAFENMGFDVKDMKDILNKLVDGIVGKNKIQVVK